MAWNPWLEVGWLQSSIVYVRSCGLLADHFTLHSLRIGAATTTALHVPTSTLKAIVRWSSSAFQRYIRFKSNNILAAQKEISSCFMEVWMCIKPGGSPQIYEVINCVNGFDWDSVLKCSDVAPHLIAFSLLSSDSAFSSWGSTRTWAALRSIVPGHT